jgi:hypothetical protein
MASCFMLFTISCNASHEAGTGFRVSYQGFIDTLQLQLVISVPFTESQLIKTKDKANLPSVRRLKGFTLLAVPFQCLFKTIPSQRNGAA